MKKMLLSVSVLTLFVLYSLHEQGEGKTAVNSVQTPLQTLPTSSNSNSSSSPKKTGTYKDGTYTGKVADAFYGNIQVKTTISNGAISDVQFLQYPNDRSDSIEINQQAMPLLRQEAISAQSAHVDIISGATDSSRAFIESLSDALSQAK